MFFTDDVVLIGDGVETFDRDATVAYLGLMADMTPFRATAEPTPRRAPIARHDPTRTRTGRERLCKSDESRSRPDQCHDEHKVGGPDQAAAADAPIHVHAAGVDIARV